ncbi:TOTE conflict system archaeo-eukaryotic primase domain-containing protein [Pontiella sulfatireligans]|uniref:DNA repair helicase RadD n=1 Tax=Pontiella sulfatireligans TaxID=2750658 RepID=A0A6C2UQJ9_9BACT|nr:DEAD/DEAH box helicase [Pontiella sulfatireligans]VGO22572.1 Putative DNA repair helicase RadD [Pontiella sulfatireligans]
MSEREEQLEKLNRELAELDRRRCGLVAEIGKLQASGEKIPVSGRVVSRFSPEEKIQLFRNLFSGRDDVFPRRFESRKSDRSGYQPVCKNEWRTGVCFKPKVKCAKCEHREFVPVSDEVVRQHLSGKDEEGKPFVMGIYPLMQDETCSFLAADFDKAEWKKDASAFLDVCAELEVAAYLERSRSGNGGHVWLFFEEAVPAGLARKLGSFILTKAMEARPELGFDSYDRFFPNQDRMPTGGFGNLIALPLQKAARADGNSEFVDRAFEPFPDQWEFLSNVRKVQNAKVVEWVKAAEQDDLILGVRTAPDEEDRTPWLMPPSRNSSMKISGKHPASVDIVLGNQVYVPKEGLSPSLRNAILRLAAFRNPEFYKAQAMRIPVFNKPRIIACAEEFPEYIGLPRGCMDELAVLFESLFIEVRISDQRMEGRPLDISFYGELRDEQLLAGKALLKRDIGVLSAPTAFGKTVLAAWLVAQRKTNVFIVVHRRQLMEQWVERLSVFLGLERKDIGQIGGGKRKISGLVDVAVIQSLNKRGVVDDLVAEYGFVIVDECHHISAKSFEDVLRACPAKYVAGLSATVVRRDGHHPIVFMQCGAVRYRAHDKKHAMQRPFDHKVVVRPCEHVAFPEEGDLAITEIYRMLMESDARNACIAEDVVAAFEEGRSPLILTERTRHLEILREMLEPEIERLVVLKGGLGKKKLAEITAKLSEWKDFPHTVLATGRYLGEGFDDPRLDTLYLAMPVSWRGVLSQYAGRLHRLHDSKSEVRIFDYVDQGHPVLARMFERRLKGYEALGYSLPVAGSELL